MNAVDFSMRKALFVAALVTLTVPWIIEQAPAKSADPDPVGYAETHKTAYQRRREADARRLALQEGRDTEEAAAAMAKVTEAQVAVARSRAAIINAQALPPLFLPSGMNPLVDLNLPHYANSPSLRKFIDTLPGLGAPLTSGALYIPVGFADQTTFPGSDYYEIALICFSQRMHSDLPATDLRGYVQMETPVVAAAMAAAGTPSKHVALSYPGGAPIMYNGEQVFAVDYPADLGPIILAAKGQPVRVKFVNLLPPGTAGNLPMPVDTGVLGAGLGPDGVHSYTQNRATLHLHGGRTPWISDGTPHQWTVPVGETSPYQRGDSAQNAPDMPDPGQGAITFYWTNEQSARLLFYHDHAYGITRLNVYAGEAAGYLIHDQVEEDLISGTNVSGVFTRNGSTPRQIIPDPLGGLYHFGIPLVIQDKTFVNDATIAVNNPTTPQGMAFAATGATPIPYTLAVDPLWSRYVSPVKAGNLWMPHEYIVNENIYDPSGITQMGRWDYGPWMNPPMVVANNVLPSPSQTPEAFMDTPVVNGCAYPTVTLPPKAVRFRILNACNDRMLNLQLYYAEPLTVRVTNVGSGYVAPAVAFSAPTGPGAVTATGTAVLSHGVGSISVGNAGTGYVTAPIVTISRAAGDNTGRDATAVATLTGGAVTAITVTNKGLDYTLPPVVTLSAPSAGGTRATATATLTGIVSAITVTNPGAGYTSAPSVTITDAGPGLGATAAASIKTEVKMVEACPNAAYPTWPKDGRDGGVPDPTTQGPPMLLIGNESGFLANLDVVPAQPVDFDYNRKNATFGGVTSKSLFLPSAVRADVIVDFSQVAPGSTLILYNDAPAPAPLYDTRYDYYTDDPDQTAVGGAPTTPPGFGPNTRTIMQINIAGTAGPAFDQAALASLLPSAFAVGQDQILVPESAYNAAYGTNNPDIFANVTTEALNVTGTPQSVATVMTTLPGLGYTTAPTVSFAGGGGTGVSASAGLNPMGGVTLVTAGSGYTSPPAVTIGPPVLPLTTLPLAPGGVVQGIQATATATISGGQVTAITITDPGAGYTDTVNAPVVTIAAPTTPGGVAATAQGMLPTLGTVGAIVLTAAGSGYTSAPQVFLTGGGGRGAAAVAMLNGSLAPTNKNITEGFDPDYGRLFVQLGSTPNPLTPAVGAGPVIGLAQYIDPPTEILTPEQTVLWRIAHIGVDSHSLHFHLFDVQLINRVDWANIVKPPQPEEVGWKDTIRTNPFEDIIVALRPTELGMKLPFGLPESNRLLDTTTPAGSTQNFLPVAAPVGVPAVAQITNVLTNFGWEYVFHCHLLAHEEHDMMRPIVMNVTTTVPTASVLSGTYTSTTGSINLTWTDPTPFNYVTKLPASTLGNPANEIGYRLERAPGASGGTFTQIATPVANATSFSEGQPAGGNTFRYRIRSWNAAGISNYSNVVTVTVPTNQSDDFNFCFVKPFWSLVDPVGGGSATITGVGTQDALLNLSVPAGTSHDAWSVNNTVRLMQTAANADFDIQVKTQTPFTVGTQMMGILVQNTPTTYLRWNVEFDGTRTFVYAATFNNGTPAQRLNRTITAATPFWLRITRTGTTWNLRYSTNGTSWTAGTTFTWTTTVGQVGVFGGNYVATGSAPAFVAKLDYYQNNASPLNPEDGPLPGGTTLTTNVVGPGTITVSPSQPTYYCGETVTLTAVPNTGAQFVSWSGDLTGTVSPQPLSMAQSHTVTATFRIPNQPPVAQAQSVTVTAGTPKTITLVATDPDGPPPLTYAIATPPVNGTLGTLNTSTGVVTYTPNPGATTDSFTFTATDGAGAVSTPATVSISVNAPPVAAAQSVNVTVGVAKSITLVATDPDGPPPLTYAIATPPVNGTLGTLNTSTGVVTYTANPGATTDSFTFTASDGAGAVSAAATVSITIVPNAAPVATAQSVTVAMGVAKTITLAATDSDGPPPLTFAIATPPANGTLGTLNAATGVVTYTANPGATTDSFTFTASDGAGAVSTPATVSITVSANAAPTATAQSVTTTTLVVTSITLSASDPDGPPPLTYAIATPPANGTLSAVNPSTGVVTYTGNAGATTDSFTFTAQDGAGAVSTPATVSITLTAPPAIRSDDFNTCTLNPFWTLTDPVGGGSATLTGQGTADALLLLNIPAGASHDLWTANDAVRLMQPAPNADFDVQAKFQSTFTAAYQMQGMLVEQDATNYLRYDLVFDGTKTFLYAATFTGAAPTQRLQINVTYGAPYWLDIQRVGNQWTLRYSSNGSTWSTAGTFSWTTTVNRVGVYGGNYSAGSAPAFTAKVDYFLNTASLFTTEDGPLACP